MNLKKRILPAAIALILTVTSLGFSALAADEVKPTRVNLTNLGNQTTFDVDESYQLSWEIYPSDAVDDQVTWSSSNEDIITVDSSGTITTHEPGTARITATTRKYRVKGTIVLTVRGSRNSNYDYDRSYDYEEDGYYYYYDENGRLRRYRTSYTVPDDQTESSRTTTASASTSSNPSSIRLTETASRDTVVNAVRNASGGSARLDNYASVSIDTLKAAANAGSAVLHFDTRTSGKALSGRLTITPSRAKNLTNTSLKLGVYYNDTKTDSLQNSYNKWYSNKVHVIKCDQTNFGMTVRVYAKIGRNADPKNLVFYSYDADNHMHSKISVQNVQVDSSGFVGFDTTVGGTIIISEGGSLSRA